LEHLSTTNGQYSNVSAFQWTPDRHGIAPSIVKRAVEMIVMIRALCDESLLINIPNELLFLIFGWLGDGTAPINPAILRRTAASHRNVQ
jgi:hypothetical protein